MQPNLDDIEIAKLLNTLTPHLRVLVLARTEEGFDLSMLGQDGKKWYADGDTLIEALKDAGRFILPRICPRCERTLSPKLFANGSGWCASCRRKENKKFNDKSRAKKAAQAGQA